MILKELRSMVEFIKKLLWKTIDSIFNREVDKENMCIFAYNLINGLGPKEYEKMTGVAFKMQNK